MFQAFRLFLIISIACAPISGDLLGKLVFHGNDKKITDALSLRIMHQPQSVHFAPSPGPLPSDEIASVMALSLGISIPKDITWSGLQFGDLFNRPKAVIMLTIDGLPEGSRLKLPTTRSFPIKPIDEVNIEEVYSVAKHSSLANHVNAIFSGKSSTVSMAADEEVSRAGFGEGLSSKVSYWSGKKESWMQVSGESVESKAEISKSEVLKKLTDVLPTGFQYDIQGKIVILNAKDLQVNFDMVDEVDFAFFSEIVNINHQYEKIIRNKKQVQDEIPDVYLFAISGLKGLERKYGADSKQFRGALYLIEQAVPKIVEDFKELYNDEVIIIGVTLKSNIGPFNEYKEEISKLIQGVKEQTNYVPDVFHQLIPEIHVPSHIENTARQKLCDQFQGSLSKLAGILKFKCTEYVKVHSLSRRSLFATTDENKELNLDMYDANFAAIFNIWFWLVVILALAMYAITLVIWNMDPGRDSIIYRLTQQKVKAD